MAWLAWRGWAWLGTARRGEAGVAGQGVAWRGMAWLAGRGVARQGEAGRDELTCLAEGRDVDKRLQEVEERMAGQTGAATLHYKHGRLMKIEYRIITTPKQDK